MTVLTAVLSGLLALLALMAFSMLNRSESTLLWQISVVAKEYGHYAAILTVVVVAALLLTAPPFWWACALVLILGILFTAAFAWPLASALRLQHRIRARASGEFPADLAINFRTLICRSRPKARPVSAPGVPPCRRSGADPRLLPGSGRWRRALGSPYPRRRLGKRRFQPACRVEFGCSRAGGSRYSPSTTAWLPKINGLLLWTTREPPSNSYEPARPSLGFSPKDGPFSAARLAGRSRACWLTQ